MAPRRRIRQPRSQDFAVVPGFAYTPSADLLRASARALHPIVIPGDRAAARPKRGRALDRAIEQDPSVAANAAGLSGAECARRRLAPLQGANSRRAADPGLRSACPGLPSAHPFGVPEWQLRRRIRQPLSQDFAIVPGFAYTPSADLLRASARA